MCNKHVKHGTSTTLAVALSFAATDVDAQTPPPAQQIAAALAAAPPSDRDGATVFGFAADGSMTTLRQGTNELICLDNQAAVAWRQPLKHGRPVGLPVASEGALYVAWQPGGLSKVSSADGAEAAHLQLETPVVAGPVALGKRFILTSPDGTLLVVDRP